MKYKRLQVESVGCSLFLSVQDALLGLLEVFVGDLHATFSQGHETSFSADRFDVSAGQIVLRHDELREIDVGRQRHLRRVDVKDATFGLLIGQREFDLSINSTRSDQSGIESLNAICRHDDFDVATRVETVELIEQLQHGSLDLSLTAGVRIVALCSYGVDFVDEDDRWSVLLSDSEELTNEFRSVTLKQDKNH